MAADDDGDDNVVVVDVDVAAASVGDGTAGATGAGLVTFSSLSSRVFFKAGRILAIRDEGAADRRILQVFSSGSLQKSERRATGC